MRDTKFKLWDKNAGSMIIQSPFDSMHRFVLDPFGGLWKTDGSGKNLSSDHELLQYTGLKDKNGIEIYEGDLVRCAHGNCIVEYGKWVSNNENNEDILGWMVMGEHSAHPLDPQSAYWVIGNIYENGDLLK